MRYHRALVAAGKFTGLVASVVSLLVSPALAGEAWLTLERGLVSARFAATAFAISAHVQRCWRSTLAPS